MLGPTLVYSCAVWTDEATGLDAAQHAKLDLVCRKLGLRPGMRLLDVGCGWGSLALHAARRYGADVVGITLSDEQATLARERVAEAGLDGRITIRVQDYRDVDDGPFDAVSSVGMAEHVGRAGMPAYAAALRDLLAPGGRLLHHAIAWAAGDTTWDDDTFIARYVFPDGELIPSPTRSTPSRSARDPRRRGAAPALRADAAGLGGPAGQAVGRRGVAWSARAGPACGGSTWPRRRCRSRPGSWASTRSWPRRSGGAPPPLRRTDWV